MLDEKIMNALADRTKEMPEANAPIDPISEGAFHAMLTTVCNDAGLYIETLWDSGARTSTGKRDLEFMAAGTRIKPGQEVVSEASSGLRPQPPRPKHQRKCIYRNTRMPEH